MDLTPEQRAEIARDRDRTLVQHARVLVDKDGPEAATVALYVLQAFVATYGPVQDRLPDDVRQMVHTATEALKAATQAAKSRVVLATAPPLVIARGGG